MSVNTLSFEQVSTILNALHGQVTGQNAIAITDTGSFISTAQVTLQAGYEPVLNSITQMVGRTIFYNRAYRGRLGLIQMDSQRWGYITRKLQIVDKPWEDEEAFNLTDGSSVDAYIVNKPEILQTNFYGQNIVQRNYTIFKNQLDSAFTGPEEFGRFMAMVSQNCMDMIEQKRETVRRMTLANFIAGKIVANNGIFHALTEYNSDTGGSYTATTIMAAANFGPFCRWLYGKMSEISKMMEERTGLFQIQITGKELNRHTPAADQRIFILSQYMEQMRARVLATTFNEGFLSMDRAESVAFWQDPQTPDEIKIKPVYLDGSTGQLVTITADANAVEQDAIIGIIFDRDAMGVTTMDETAAVTPMNASGLYWNQFYHFIERYYNDFTEKGVVFILD